MNSKVLRTLIPGLLALSTLVACSAPGMNPAFQPQPRLVAPIQSQTAGADLNAQYLITAQALIDKIVTVRNPNDQSKMKKDFELNIRSLNRYALNNLGQYAVNVLNTHLQPGQDPMSSPVVVLIEPILERLMTIHARFAERAVEMVVVASASSASEQEQLLQRFGSNVRRLPKVDVRELAAMVERNEGDFFPPGAPITQRLQQILQGVLAQ